MPKNILELPDTGQSVFKRKDTQYKTKKIMADDMAALMAVQPMTAFATTELTNSTASSFTEDMNGYDTVGEDVTQEQVAESKEITDITDSTYAAEEEAEIYATQKFQG